jgi:transcriptional regulator with XRE-family HTH domain
MGKKGEAGHTLGQQLGTRVLYAHMLLSQVEDLHVSLREFGERVAAEERRLWPERAPKNDYSASSVSRWEQGTEPSLLTFCAIANVLNRALKSARRTDRIDPGWLAFGAATAVTAPVLPQYTLADLASVRTSGRGGGRG